MRITKYRTELDTNRHNVLVKEAAINYVCDRMDSPQLVVKMFNDVFGLNRMAEEYVYMLALSAAYKVLGVFEVSHGTVSMAVASPREIFIRLLLSGASHFVICHNHPSGDCTPSKEDIGLTVRFKRMFWFMEIIFADHIITDSGYYSLKKTTFYKVCLFVVLVSGLRLWQMYRS